MTYMFYNGNEKLDLVVNESEMAIAFGKLMFKFSKEEMFEIYDSLMVGNPVTFTSEIEGTPYEFEVLIYENGFGFSYNEVGKPFAYTAFDFFDNDLEVFLNEALIPFLF